jgi:hypothetical protein
MCLFQGHPLYGEFLFLSRKGEVTLTRSARQTARERYCGELHARCLLCGIKDTIISEELALALQNPEFALPAPLTREQARRWKPPQV